MKWNSSPSPGLLWWLTVGLLFVLLLYVAIADVRYRWRHPELTETQLWMRIEDILLWRD